MNNEVIGQEIISHDDLSVIAYQLSWYNGYDACLNLCQLTDSSFPFLPAGP